MCQHLLLIQSQIALLLSQKNQPPSGTAYFDDLHTSKLYANKAKSKNGKMDLQCHLEIFMN